MTLKLGEVHLEEYNSNWKEMYKKEEEQLKELNCVENFKHLFTSDLGYDFRDDSGVKREYLVRK